MKLNLESSAAEATPPLLRGVRVGPYDLPNRVIMAPLTRMRAGDGNVPRSLNAEYYRQRAGAGLIVTEGTPVSPYGHGYADTPGIHSSEQVEGWKLITSAVHDAGGRIYAQLWHVGRQSHPLLQPGGVLPVGPSAVASGESAPTRQGLLPHPAPRALELSEIPGIVEEFRQGAINAMRAGFDGVEVHGANGYLLDQFLHDNSNLRTDEYGGSIENRTRFFLEVTAAVVSVWGGGRTGVRISPGGEFGGVNDSNRLALFSTLVKQLNRFSLGYIHLVVPRVARGQDVEVRFNLGPEIFRPLITGDTKLIAAGGYKFKDANETVAKGWADAIAFGRLFIANPDLPRRFSLQSSLNAYDRSTFYGGGAAGYTDYPALEELATCSK
jgi:N-ethylmaleimide reductase